MGYLTRRAVRQGRSVRPFGPYRSQRVLSKKSNELSARGVDAWLQKRGDLTVWLSDAAFDAWHARAAALVCERIDDETGLNNARGLLRRLEEAQLRGG